MTEDARPVWDASHDPHVLQQFLKDHGCHGIDAVLTTRNLLECSMRDAQIAFFTAPCRAAELDFQNQFLDALESIADDVVVHD
ncbi:MULTISPECIES: hypothetical protein [unclassified Kitasatospora]|uniref:hypothetical protein n=1 Tax=unclassified Kitasatospora TaxID=2633591 RepID=UPI0012FBDE88|nr:MULTISPECIES: hypothetical protein [unclassified Kitasatospora]